jgi:predicted dehydrogenase
MDRLTRRKFVKSAATVAAGAFIIPGLHSCSPNNKLNVAFVGVGGRGNKNRLALPTDEEGNIIDNIVALCDVDDVRAAEGYDAAPNAKRFTDFREMFDKMHKQIDAVVISTPDHTHFAAAMDAMERGIHVYVEKPLAHNIWQLRTLKKAAKHYKVVTQMGNQGHTTEGIRFIKEWYEAGVLGEVREVIAWFNGPNFHEKGYFNKPGAYPPPQEPVPATLNWDAWQGPVSGRPYSHFYLPKWWRGWYEYGNALLGDWACHTLDGPFWSLDLGMPTRVESIERTSSGEGFIPDQSQIRYQFPARGSKPPVTLTWHDGGLKPEMREEWGLEEMPGSGMIMVGSDKSLMTGGRPNRPELLVSEAEWEAFKQAIPKRTIPRVDEEAPVLEWIKAIKGEGAMPGSTFEYAADLTEMALIGVMAQRFDAQIDYDAENMKVSNHPEFDQYIKEPAREGWQYGEDLWS